MINNKVKKTYHNNFKEYENWLEKRNLSQITVKVYGWCLREYGEREINTDEIVSFFKEKVSKYQPHSLQHFRKTLSSYAKFKKIYIEWELISRLIPVEQQKFFPTINETELEQLKQTTTRTKSVTNQRNNLILEFLFFSGVRVSELVNIRHCDYQNESLWIRGKGNKIRYVFIPYFLAKHFNGSSDYLFKTWRNKKMSDIQVRTMIRQKSKKAGLTKHISPHTFRRSFATLLNSRNCKLTTIQKLLGHSEITTTANYIHNDYNTLFADYNKIFTPPPNINSFKNKER
ncbi:MAG: tyrosine-type recombinase/integrase [Candidatus Moeniiplasma glomeromycotorum]|nr:tyrosine-type recombinase/integrase [Candidatus Moeniiplasma glomeromycotorum]